MRDENLKHYINALSKADIELKGKTMPYTSSNGYMFSQLNKAGELGVRLSKEDTVKFDSEYGVQPFLSYGAKMREYVLVPQQLVEDTEAFSAWLKSGLDYVNTLPPK